jgi:hypothetical protein
MESFGSKRIATLVGGDPPSGHLTVPWWGETAGLMGVWESSQAAAGDAAAVELDREQEVAGV